MIADLLKCKVWKSKPFQVLLDESVGVLIESAPRNGLVTLSNPAIPGLRESSWLTLDWERPRA
jgi:hypothetical protein